MLPGHAMLIDGATGLLIHAGAAAAVRERERMLLHAAAG